LKPAGSPRIEGAEAAPGSAFEFTAIIELYPEIELKALAGITVERTTVEIADADVDKMIETLRRQRASWNPVDRAAAKGDRVTVDFEGRLDGTVFNGGTGKDVSVVIGDGRFLQGFEDNLVGADAGEQREFDLPFPADYPNTELAGKTAHFSATVNEVAELELPPVDQEFCVAFGVDEGGVDKLKVDVRANMQVELNQRLRRMVKQQVLDGLVSLHQVELPASLVKDELQRLKMEAWQRMGAAAREDQPDLPENLFRPQAERRVTLGLLIAELIRVHEVKLDAARVRAMVQEIADGYDDPRRVIDAYNKNPQMMQGVEAMAMEEQVVDMVLEQAKVTAKPATFDEVMNR
jgi:trigger factor